MTAGAVRTVTTNASRTESHTCQHPWPENVYVQAGSSGVVISPTGGYRTAFFEAFPQDPQTFLRGEGGTVAEAEDAAWVQYEQVRSCTEHDPHRAGYRNGGGRCRNCKMFMSGAFDPIPVSDDERASVAELLGGIDGRSAAELRDAARTLDGPAAERAGELSYAMGEIIAGVQLAELRDHLDEDDL